MNREEIEQAVRESQEQMEKAMRTFIEALIIHIRIRVQKDILFIETGDKTLVDRK